MEKLILNSIEIVDVPAVALAAAEDYADSSVRLVEWIESLESALSFPEGAFERTGTAVAAVAARASNAASAGTSTTRRRATRSGRFRPAPPSRTCPSELGLPRAARRRASVSWCSADERRKLGVPRTRGRLPAHRRTRMAGLPMNNPRLAVGRQSASGPGKATWPGVLITPLGDQSGAAAGWPMRRSDARRPTGARSLEFPRASTTSWAATRRSAVPTSSAR